tara:strand:+ start:69 stop:473 length:405 start_codon:yes stop_codon:yes gene_type:complete
MFTAFFWKKAWTWFKNYWYWPVIIVLLIFSLLSGRSSRKKLFGLLDKQKENYERELEVVKKASEEASKEKTTIAEKYTEDLKKIEEEHAIRAEELKKEKQKEIESVLENNRDDPDKLAREVAKILSAHYHKNNR